jgi:hypothetical protein
MARRGRTPKLTPELTAAFCDAVAGGMSRAKAAAGVGITPKTVCRWMQSGRAGRGAAHVHFVHEVRAAEARFIATNLTAVRRAAQPRVERVTRTITRPDGTATVEVTEREACDWHAAKWLLECKDRDTFGPDRVEIAALRKELAELRRQMDGRDDLAARSVDGDTPVTGVGNGTPAAEHSR